MPSEKLKTGIIGLNKDGQALLEAAGKTPYFKIQAVAGREAEILHKTAGKYACEGFDDYRQFIINNQFDVLFVCSPLHTCIEHIHAAIAKKFNILKLKPLARHFDEAAIFVNSAQQQGVKFAVANTMRFASSFCKLKDYIQQNQHELLFFPSVLLD